MDSEFKWRIEPFDLPKVKKEHYPGIFGEFHSVVGARIKALGESRAPHAGEKVKFFKYLLDIVDPVTFGEIQDEYASPSTVNLSVDLPKYIDPIIWFESKLMTALRMGLNESDPKRMLDFGTGPGHFPVVAKYLGHDITGTELPRRSQGVDVTGHLYDRLCDLYGVKRISHIVAPRPVLRNLGGPYDYVTSFLTAFNTNANKKPWSTTSWNVFFRELRTHVLTPEGSVYMTLTNNKLTPAAWRYLSALATMSVDSNKTLFFENLDFVDGLAVDRAKVPQPVVAERPVLVESE